MFLKLVIIYALTLAVFLAIDLVWLLKIAPKFYKKHLGHLMADKPNGPAALIFYLLFMVGLVIFAIYPSYDGGAWWQALLYGALFGLFTYATYDLTNMATLKGWPVKVTIIDLIWGTSISAATSLIVFFLATVLGV
ncbi:MAG: DUF2177 family protein [Bacilli bacterium]|jgi:uncharacterized membrane protein